MEGCRGISNWFECIDCDNICTSRCPIEGKDSEVMVELSARLSASADAKRGDGRSAGQNPVA